VGKINNLKLRETDDARPWMTYLHEDFDVKDYGHLDLVRRAAFHQHLALVLLSSSSCTSICDFETKSSPETRQTDGLAKGFMSKLFLCQSSTPNQAKHKQKYLN